MATKPELTNTTVSSSTPPLRAYQATQVANERQVLLGQRRASLIKDEEKKIIQQILGSLALTVVLLLIYVFLVLPLMIRFAGNIGNLTAFQQKDTIPPRVPAYSAPPQAIQERSIDISGFGENKAKIFAVKNGKESGETVIGDNGEFKISISLEDGSNELALYSVDEAGNESSLGKTYTIISDDKDPEVEWTTPEDKKVVTNLREKIIDIKGKVNESAKVLLNDKIIGLNESGEFSTSYSLNQGGNTLKLIVTDLAGNSVEQERIVEFKP